MSTHQGVLRRPGNFRSHRAGSANLVTPAGKKNTHFLGTEALLHLFNRKSHFFGIKITVTALLPGQEQAASDRAWVAEAATGGRQSPGEIPHLHLGSTVCWDTPPGLCSCSSLCKDLAKISATLLVTAQVQWQWNILSYLLHFYLLPEVSFWCSKVHAFLFILVKHI